MKTKLIVAALAVLLAAGCQEAKAGNWAVAGAYAGGGGAVSAQYRSGNGHYGGGHRHYGGYRGYGYGGVVAAPVYPIYNNAFPIDPYRGYRTYPTVVYSAPVVVYSDPVADLQAMCRPGVSKVESGNITVHCNN